MGRDGPPASSSVGHTIRRYGEPAVLRELTGCRTQTGRKR